MRRSRFGMVAGGNNGACETSDVTPGFRFALERQTNYCSGQRGFRVSVQSFDCEPSTIYRVSFTASGNAARSLRQTFRDISKLSDCHVTQVDRRASSADGAYQRKGR